MAKKSVTESTNKKNKKKSSKKTAPNVVAMKNKTPKPQNLFETIWSRRKFDILGKKRKGEQRRDGLARSLALEKVLKTIVYGEVLEFLIYLTLCAVHEER